MSSSVHTRTKRGKPILSSTKTQDISEYNQLLLFHEGCKPEFDEILKSFNILFYGYGCKDALLTRMFPSARKFNMKFSNRRSIAEDLLLEGLYPRCTSTLKDIDNRLIKEGETLLLIFLNFRPSDEFRNLKNIRFIATMENISTRFDLHDLLDCNFILRDLTTFENYVEETMEVDIIGSKVSSVLTILNNLSSKPKAVFRELLKLGNCTTNEIFDVVKKPLFLIRTSSMLELLHEFIDHNIIKLTESKIEIKLSKEDRRKILNHSILNDSC